MCVCMCTMLCERACVCVYVRVDVCVLVMVTKGVYRDDCSVLWLALSVRGVMTFY